MGCTVSDLKETGSISDPMSPRDDYSPDLSDRGRPKATESEVLSQLAQEGIIPSKRRQGGVAYSFPDICQSARKPFPLLEKLPKRIQFMNLEERLMLADIQRHQHLEKKRENVRRKNQKAQEKHRMLKEKRHKSVDSGLKEMSFSD